MTGELQLRTVSGFTDTDRIVTQARGQGPKSVTLSVLKTLNLPIKRSLKKNKYNRFEASALIMSPKPERRVHPKFDPQAASAAEEPH